MKSYYFDIETGVDPDRIGPVLEATEFKAPPTYKKPEAIEKYIREAKEKAREKAALNPLVGRVLAIGIGSSQPMQGFTMENILTDDDEAKLLSTFWAIFSLECTKAIWFGFNVMNFDLPFMVKRSRLLGVKPSPQVSLNRIYETASVIDIMDAWNCGIRTGSMVSLDALCKAFKIPGKTGSGKDFEKLFNSDYDKAIEYLEQDVKLVYELKRRIL